MSQNVNHNVLASFNINVTPIFIVVVFIECSFIPHLFETEKHVPTGIYILISPLCKTNMQMIH